MQEYIDLLQVVLLLEVLIIGFIFILIAIKIYKLFSNLNKSIKGKVSNINNIIDYSEENLKKISGLLDNMEKNTENIDQILKNTKDITDDVSSVTGVAKDGVESFDKVVKQTKEDAQQVQSIFSKLSNILGKED